MRLKWDQHPSGRWDLEDLDVTPDWMPLRNRAFIWPPTQPIPNVPITGKWKVRIGTMGYLTEVHPFDTLEEAKAWAVAMITLEDA